jgi:rubrerythrin
MEISALLTGIVLLCAAVAYVSLPFWEKRKKSIKDSTSTQPEAGHEAVLAALRDLDFDFKTGKVSEDDYQSLRAQLLVQAAQYIEAERKAEEQLEALIQSRRKNKQPVRMFSCPSCGNKIHGGDLFCSSCGTKLEIRREAVA